MGKSEILMLLAGVALSVMLAMIAIPMFSSGGDMADRQQVQQDLMSIKSSIPLILALEGNDNGKFSAKNIETHVKGFEKIGDDTTKIIVNTKNKDNENKKTTYTITDGDIGGKVTIEVESPKGFDLAKINRLTEICNGDTTVPSVTTDTTSGKQKFTCKINR